MIFIETTFFTKQIMELLSNAEYRKFQSELLLNPKSGSVVSGGGGLRKIRYGTKAKGKSGGIRVIYYHHTLSDKIYLLIAYSKNQKDNLDQKELEILRNLIRGLK